MRMKLLVVLAGAGLVIATRPAVAHHSFAAEFDANQPVTLHGTITKMEWINPHSWIHIDVKRADGQVEKWMIEAGNPGGLIRMGWTRNSVPPGTEIVVEGYKAKDGSLKANGKSVLLPDGRKLFAGSPGTGAPQ